MKFDKKTLTILLIAFCALALIVAVPATFSGKSEYKSNLKTARELYEKDLCLKAIEEYEKAVAEEDSLELELEIADVYFRAIENGELTKTYDYESFLENMVTTYREEAAAYEKALNYYYTREDYESVVELLAQAKKLGVKSDLISDFTEKVRYKYSLGYTIITDVKRSTQSYYTVRDSKVYYIYDKNMKSVFSRGFDYASVYVNDYVVAKNGNYAFIMDSTGKRIAYLDKDIDFSTGFGSELVACRKDNTFSYYNLSGEKVFGDYKYAGRFRENYAAVETDSGWCLIDTEGKVVGDKYFEDIKLGMSYECLTNGVFFAKENGKYKIYNTKLECVSDAEYDDCGIFVNKDSFAAVCVDDKWGFINIKGEEVIKPEYDSAKSFSNGFAAVTKDKECFFINETNEKVITGEFSEGDYFTDGGLCLVKGNTFWQPLELYYTLDK